MIPIIKTGTKSGKLRIEQILSRSQLDYGNIREDVDKIISAIRNEGDAALFAFTEKWDDAVIDQENICVTTQEIKGAYESIDDALLKAIKTAIRRITDFHEKQKRTGMFDVSGKGEFLGQLIRPLEIVGVYAPGGKAAYPSSVLMNLIPAKVAGVERIIMLTPPNSEGKLNPAVLVAAHEAGVSEIYKAGGAQAIAAMAFGTKSIPKVDKIVGPGNIYVALAKRSVYGYVNIDSVAGPSEILIIADDSAKARYVAADMLSQAEHDELASSILITTSEKLAEKVNNELQKQSEKLERRSIVEKSLADFGAIILTGSLEEAVKISNKIAPEHLEICTKEPFTLLSFVKNAGAVFLGNYTPEPLGDYIAGPNHVLPTGGTARFYSPLSVDDFIKKSSVLSFSYEAFSEIAEDCMVFANGEGFGAHANAIKERVAKKGKSNAKS